ncbi:hypothetical protein QM042_01990 [Escherichia coli]|uniref:hypothetical protein n=1 Tax=Escherichia coli TaxID=562 RepID=UPI0039872038
MEVVRQRVFPNISEAMQKEFKKDLLKFLVQHGSANRHNKSVLTYDRDTAQLHRQF